MRRSARFGMRGTDHRGASVSPGDGGYRGRCDRREHQSRLATLASGPAYPVCTHWALAREAAPPFEPPAPAPLPEQRTDGGAAPEPPNRCALTAQRRTVVVARFPPASRAAYGVAEVLRLPKVEEPVQEAVSGLGKPRIAAQVRIRDHPVVGDLADRRPHLPLIGAPFVVAFLAGMIRARVLALTIGLVIAALVGFALLLFRRRPPPSA